MINTIKCKIKETASKIDNLQEFVNRWDFEHFTVIEQREAKENLVKWGIELNLLKELNKGNN